MGWIGRSVAATIAEGLAPLWLLRASREDA